MFDYKSILRDFEGGYANAAGDKGGETWCGIARNFWPLWEGWARIDAAKKDQSFPKNLDTDFTLHDMKDKFYLDNFIYKYSLDKMPDIVGAELFDQLINRSQKNVIMDLQFCLNAMNCVYDKTTKTYKKIFDDLTADGNMGPKTIAAVQAVNAAALEKALNRMQGHNYVITAAVQPGQRKFFNGWLART